MNAVVSAFTWLYVTVVVTPLRDLFMKGPKFGEMGFWMGMEEPDICSEMTRTSSDIWRENPSRCSDVIASRFESLHTLVRVALSWYLGYLVLRGLLKLLWRLPSLLMHSWTNK